MDHITLLFRAFLIGITSACGVGPVFVLLCNTAVRRGFLAAFAIAAGASVADSLYFYAALSGLLSWWSEFEWFVRFFDIAMCGVFILLGLHYIYSKKEKVSIEDGVEVRRYYEGFLKGFFLTMLNPFVALYFLGISAKFLSVTSSQELLLLGFEGSFAVWAGSSCMLGLVAGLVRFVGVRFNTSRLDFLNKLTGYVFLLLALYFAYSFAICFLH